MFDAIAEMLGAWGPSAKDPWLKGVRNSMDAYDDAWAKRETNGTSIELFIGELKAHNVPGAYTRPEARADLFLWFDSWEQARTPDEVKGILRARYEAQRE